MGDLHRRREIDNPRRAFERMSGATEGLGISRLQRSAELTDELRAVLQERVDKLAYEIGARHLFEVTEDLQVDLLDCHCLRLPFGEP